MKILLCQSGRSMIEMLGVLAIVGVLSVGTLAGYSMAMTDYKIGKAKSEITEMIINTQHLYSDRSNYSGLTKEIADDAGITAPDQINVFGKGINLRVDYYDDSRFVVDYEIPYNQKVCQKLITAGWEDLGSTLYALATWDGSTGTSFKLENGDFPVTLDAAQAACTADVSMIGIRVQK